MRGFTVTAAGYCGGLFLVVAILLSSFSAAGRVLAFAGAGGRRRLLLSHSLKIDVHYHRWHQDAVGWRSSPLPNWHEERTTAFTRAASSSSSSSSSSTATDPDFGSSDPFRVLGIQPTADTKVIKRAYKRLALQYHPDVSKDDNKKRASDRFAKINWAYQTVSGKGGGSTTASSSTSSSASSSSASSGWTPPHRRSGGTTSSSSSSSGRSSSASDSSFSTDWRDYLPRDSNDDDTMYDAGGDSFGAIFRDLVTGAAATAVGVGARGGGVFRDFVEFLEQNVEGYSPTSSFRSSSTRGGGDDDAELRVLLQTGSLEEIADELDTTELVVQQLTEKRRTLDNERVMAAADAKAAMKYLDQLDAEEKVAELEARIRVVDKYLQTARKRLLALQTTYKQRIVQGANDPVAGGGRRRQGEGRDPNAEFRSATSTTASSSSQASATRSVDPSTSNRPRYEQPEDAWKGDSFGSSGRGRGSGTRRRSPRNSVGRGAYAADAAQTSGATSDEPPSTRTTTPQPRTTDAPARPQSQLQSQSQPDVPPHRRAPFAASQVDDQRRLRELKVDDAFDQLKRDLGL